MKKISAIVAIGILVIGGLGAVAIPESESTEQETAAISFSQPLLQENDQYVIIDIDEANSYLIKTDKPLLPSYTHTFTFPFGTKIKDVECIPSSVQQQHVSKKIIPSPEPVLAGQQIVQAEKIVVSYGNDPYPNTWFEYDVGCGISDKGRCMFVKVQVFPVQYYPLEDVINVASDFEINVKYEESDGQTLTFDDEYDFVILAPSKFSSTLNTLVAHKNGRNISTKLVTLIEVYNGIYFPAEGRDDAEQIKYFIKNAIENWGTTNVLLVGGSNEFPTRTTHIFISDDPPEPETFVSDLYYADIYNDTSDFCSWDSNENDVFAEYKWNGNNDDMDLYPDVKLGRLACTDDTEVTTCVNKIIHYENGDAYTKNWFNNIVVIGGDTCPDENDDPEEEDIDEGEHLNQAVLDVMDGFIPNKIWDSNGRLSGFLPSGVDNINDGINNGCGFIDWSGHGAPWVWTTYPHNGDRQTLPTPTGSYRNSDISDLHNGYKLPIVMCGGCSLGKFNANDNCFAWAYLSNPDGGGIASFGATGLGYIYCGKYITYGLVEGFMLNLFEAYDDGAITFGEMWNNAINDYISGNLDGGDYKTLTELVPFGDPTLAIAKESMKPVKPDAPEGPTSGKINEEHTYTASTTDPDGDELYYLFDWGNGEFSGWIGPHNSGETVEASYAWTEKGDYEIKVKAKDEHGVQGDWSDPLPVSMPKNKAIIINQLFQKFLEQHPNMFPILQYMLRL